MAFAAIPLILTAVGTAAAVGGTAMAASARAKAASAASAIEIENAQRTADLQFEAGETEVTAAQHEAEVAAYNARTGAENAAKAAEARAEADVFNAGVADRTAESVIRAGAADANDYRARQNARLASTRAVRAASGVQLTGSALLVDETLVNEIELGAERIGINTSQDEQTFRSESKLLRISAAREIETAKNVRETGAISEANALRSGELSQEAARIRQEASQLNLDYRTESANLRKKTARKQVAPAIIGAVGSAAVSFAGSKAGSSALQSLATQGSAFS